MEGQKEGNVFILYGVVFGLIDNEYGYVSLNEMADLTIDASKYGLGVLKVELVEEFKACRLTEIGMPISRHSSHVCMIRSSNH